MAGDVPSRWGQSLSYRARQSEAGDSVRRLFQGFQPGPSSLSLPCVKGQGSQGWRSGCGSRQHMDGVVEMP